MLRSVSTRAFMRVSARMQWRGLSTKAEELPADLQNMKEMDSEDGELLRSLHNSHFNAQSLWPSASLFDVRSGAYVPVSTDVINKYMPEGVSKGVIDEFSFSRNQSWMVRDTTRLLCRLLEAKEATLQGTQKPTINHQSPAYFSSIELPRLTDRPEWESSQHEITRYGVPVLSPNDESHVSARSVGSEEGMTLSKGGESLLERTVQKIEQAGGIPDKILLSGPAGCGKSFALTQMVLHARMRDWIVVYVPNGWDHVMSGAFVEPVGRKDSKGRGLYDNAQMSAHLMRNLLRAHAPVLRSLPIKDAHALRKYNTPLNYFKDSITRALKVHGKKNPDFLGLRSIVLEDDSNTLDDLLDKEFIQHLDLLNFELKTLEDFLLLGLAIKDVAGFAFSDLIRELRQVESVPVLFAVDEMNTWEADSAFSVDNHKVFGRDISVPRALSFIEKKKAATDAWTVKNGLCIGATSYSHVEGRGETFEDVLPSVPLRIKMPNYSQIEFLSSVAYYLNHAPVDASLTYEDLLLFRMHSMSNPLVVREQATPFLMPRSVRASESEMQMALLMSVADFNSGSSDAAADSFAGGRTRHYRKRSSNRQTDDSNNDADVQTAAVDETK